MNKYIQKQEFLELCDALEKNIITLEQFQIISNIADKNERKAFLNLMMLDELKTKDEILKKIINRHDRQLVCCILVDIFNEIPKYKTDLERQNFVLEIIGLNPILTKSIVNLFQFDFFWNNKEFLEDIKNHARDINKTNNSLIHGFCLITNGIAYEIEQNTTEYEKEEIIKLLPKAYELPNSEMAEDYIKCLRIESIQEEPVLLESLISAYNGSSNSKWRVRNLTCYKKLREIEENNRFAPIIEKLKEINASEEPEKDKEKKLLNFFDNLLKIEQEKIETYEDEYFKTLIDYATDEENFYQTKELVEFAKCGNATLEEISKIKEEIDKIGRDNVRNLALYTYFEDKNLFNTKPPKYLRTVSYDEAKLLITQLAIRKNSQKLMEEGLEYFGERFKEGFIEYLSNENLTKEELLAIRDKVKTMPSKFMSRQATFIVDTSSIVEEKEPTEEMPVEKTENQQALQEEKGKGLIKSLLSKFQK